VVYKLHRMIHSDPCLHTVGLLVRLGMESARVSRAESYNIVITKVMAVRVCVRCVCVCAACCVCVQCVWVYVCVWCVCMVRVCVCAACVCTC